VTCRSCGAEIDAKAIICYRCGAPTADASTLTARPRTRRIPVALVVAVVLVVAAIIVYVVSRPAVAS
jgi:uncharacterized membrane protein (UPF0136 family)